MQKYEKQQVATVVSFIGRQSIQNYYTIKKEKIVLALPRVYHSDII